MILSADTAALPMLRGIGTALLLACLYPASSGAQSTLAPSISATRRTVPQVSKPGAKSRLKLKTAAEIEYDDNVFLLADSKKDNLDTPSASAVSSGRYTNMESATDVVAMVSAALPFSTRGALGRSLDVQPAVAYRAYTKNGERSNLTLGLAAEQDLPRGSHLRLRAGLTPSYFARNYLADAVDADGSGNISSAERVYRAGTYRETDLSVDYRIRLDKSTRQSPIGAALQVAAGYYARAFEAPFEGRDLSGPTVGVKLLGELTRRVGVDLEYAFASLGADVSPQVLILDETDAGRDLNGNSTVNDRNVRVADLVDRSRREQSVGARVKFELAKRTDLAVDAEHRWRSYTSEQALDAAYNGRRAARDQVGAEITGALGSEFRLTARGSYATQVLNRSTDLDGSGEDDYSRIQVAAGVRYTF